MMSVCAMHCAIAESEDSHSHCPCYVNSLIGNTCRLAGNCGTVYDKYSGKGNIEGAFN